MRGRVSASAVFPAASRQAFAALYPARAGIIAHGLGDHPLMQLSALAELAEALPADSVEHNPGDVPVGVDPGAVPASPIGPADAIRAIATCGHWVVLKRIEQVPAYAALLRAVLGEIAAIVAPRTGAMHGLEGFVFVSSPDAVTPFHFDPEHNILMQLRGIKTVAVFPAGDETLNPAEAQEAFHLGERHRNLPWQDAFAGCGTALTIGPGQAIHVPVKAPHWVRNGPEPSVSLSLTWRSEWSYAEADAHALNRVLRRLGLRPQRPGPFPAANRGKALAWRALRRLGA